MMLNVSPRKEFAENVVQAITAVVKEYGLEDIVIERRANPMLIAVRGCLQDGKVPVEVAVLVSDNIARAELRNGLATEVNVQVPTAQIYRSFDISESIAKETAVDASRVEPESPCDDDDPTDKPKPPVIE